MLVMRCRYTVAVVPIHFVYFLVFTYLSNNVANQVYLRPQFCIIPGSGVFKKLFTVRVGYRPTPSVAPPSHAAARVGRHA